MPGFKTFTATTLSAADVNGYLMQQTVIQCTSGTRPSSPHEGMVIFETDTDRYAQYSGAAWSYFDGSGAWHTYSTWPSVTTGTWTGVTSGIVTAAYRYVGARAVEFLYRYQVNTASPPSDTAAGITVPLPVSNVGTANELYAPSASMYSYVYDGSSGVRYTGVPAYISSDKVLVGIGVVSGSRVIFGGVAWSDGATWGTLASADHIVVGGTYETAA